MCSCTFHDAQTCAESRADYFGEPAACPELVEPCTCSCHAPDPAFPDLDDDELEDVFTDPVDPEEEGWRP